jgi:class 3 adenylate cyclase
MSQTLPVAVPEAAILRLATGVGAGQTVVSRLGERGNRDMICLGKGVRRAESIQRSLDGGELGISGTVHGALPEELSRLFEWKAAKQAYIRADVTTNVVGDALAAEHYRIRDAGGVGAAIVAPVDSPSPRKLPQTGRPPEPERPTPRRRHAC